MRCIPQDPIEMPVHRRFEYPPRNKPDTSFFQIGGIDYEETQQAFSHPCNRLRYGYDDGRSGVCHWKPNRKLRQIQNLPDFNLQRLCLIKRLGDFFRFLPAFFTQRCLK